MLCIDPNYATSAQPDLGNVVLSFCDCSPLCKMVIALYVYLPSKDVCEN